MIWIIVLLVGVLSITVGYLFYLKDVLKKISLDIQERKRIQTNTLVTSESQMKEIRMIVNQFNEVIQKYRRQEQNIEKKNSQLQKTIINISHDLRTPLTSAIGYIEMIQTYDIDESKKKEYENTVRLKLIELTNLIEDFFIFTKVISDEEKIVLEEIDMNHVFEETMIEYYQAFSIQNRQVYIEGNQEIKRVSNERMLRHIFDNIISNSLYHSQSDVYITIEVTDKIQYISRNTVIGSIEVENIFNEFYTADISRTKQHTGLGLAIVKEFVERLGGEVMAKQEDMDLYIVLHWPNKQ